MAIQSKLTETRIDLGDCHTTLHQFLKPKPAAPLEMGSAGQYQQLYAEVDDAGRIEYGDVANGRAPVILSKLMAAYEHAVRARYRFFSYGDAMFLTPAGAQ